MEQIHTILGRIDHDHDGAVKVENVLKVKKKKIFVDCKIFKFVNNFRLLKQLARKTSN